MRCAGQRGKYVADGQYSSTYVDQQVGVVPLLGSIDGAKAPTDISPRQKTKEDIWETVLAGQKLLKRGMNGIEVTILQEHLKDLGYLQNVDGDFGPGTEAAVHEFQRENELSVDGLVGGGTATAIMQALQHRQNAESSS